MILCCRCFLAHAITHAVKYETKHITIALCAAVHDKNMQEDIHCTLGCNGNPAVRLFGSVCSLSIICRGHVYSQTRMCRTVAVLSGPLMREALIGERICSLKVVVANAAS